MADHKQFKVNVISPERQFFDGEVDMLELKTTEGEIGILAGHIPLTSIVAPGVMRLINSGEAKEAALHDGFVKISGDKVTILAESCEWPDEIDINRAKEAKIRAERRLKSGEGEISETRAEMALRRSLTRIELAERFSK